MSQNMSSPEMGTQEMFSKIQDIVRRHVPRLVDVMMVKTALETARKYIEAVEDDSGEKAQVLTVVAYALSKVEAWESKIMHDIASQIMTEVSQGE